MANIFLITLHPSFKIIFDLDTANEKEREEKKNQEWDDCCLCAFYSLKLFQSSSSMSTVAWRIWGAGNGKKKLCGRVTVIVRWNTKRNNTKWLASIFSPSKNLLTSQFSRWLHTLARWVLSSTRLVRSSIANFYALFGTHLPHEQLNESARARTKQRTKIISTAETLSR